MDQNRNEIIRPNSIILATDGSDGAGLAARTAADLSRKTGAKLHVVHAWRHHIRGLGYPTVAWTDYSYLDERGARRVLESQVDALEAAGDLSTEPHLLKGTPVDAILDLCEELQPGLLVMGSRGLGPVGRLLVGSVSLGVVHHADRPVLVVRGSPWPPVKVVIGEDFSEEARSAAGLGVPLAELLEAETVLVHVYEGMPPHPETLPRDERELYKVMVEKYLGRAEPALEARAAELEDAYGLRPRVVLREGESAWMLSEVAEEGGGTGLLVVGSRGLGPGGRMLFGSVSTKVLMAARGPVLVRPSGDVDDEGG